MAEATYIVECPHMANVVVGTRENESFQFNEDGIAIVPEKYITAYLNNKNFKVVKQGKKASTPVEEPLTAPVPAPVPKPVPAPAPPIAAPVKKNGGKTGGKGTNWKKVATGTPDEL